ncbi:MAG TPA: thiamine-binding protein [Segetibacter sp.]|jgi:uncharacterized protein (TIGR00106 family)|nr:thiamine-binding protein [Segetibacter sp.]
MHNYIVNASIQILPIVQDKHPYEWVDEAISVIQKSGIKYKIGPFTTVVEGSYEEVMHVVNNVNEHLIRNKCNEWITSVQFNIRSNSDITASEKVSKFIV